MKKYPELDESTQRETMQRRLDELKLFQCLLRDSEEMKVMYRGKAKAIAEGIQPWIDALEISLSE